MGDRCFQPQEQNLLGLLLAELEVGMGSAWGFWKVRKFLSEPEEAPTHSRTTVPARDTGVTPGRAGRAFVPGAVLENVWSRESVLAASPELRLHLGRRAGKALPRTREKVGNRVMPGSAPGEEVLGEKMGFKG